MRKRRERSEIAETLIREEAEEGGEANMGKEAKGFFACYLLVSLCPRHKGQTYIGFALFFFSFFISINFGSYDPFLSYA
jgi:structure-specific endonuclease subunit SLX1